MNRWGILAVLFTARAVMGFQFQSIASISNFLVPDLGIEYTEIGTLVGLYLLPGIIVAYPSGALGKRFGDARMVMIGLVMMAVGGFLVGFGDDYTTAIVGRVICGIGAVFLNILLTKMAIDWFAGRELITAMAVFLNSWPFGIAVGLVSLGWIAENWSWPTAQYIAAGASLVAFLLMIALYREPPADDSVSEVEIQKRGLSAKELLLTCLAGLIWCLFNVALIVVISFAPNVLYSNGVSLTDAAVLVSVGTWLGIASVPVAGYIAQRFKAANAVMITCFVSAALSIVWIPEASWVLGPFIIFGILAWAPAGPIMALPAEVLSPENRAPGMGVFFSWYYIGMGLVPAVAGLTYDLSGNPAAPLYLAAASMFVCIPLLGAFRLLKNHASP